MRVWRMSLQRTKSTIITWYGSYMYVQKHCLDILSGIVLVLVLKAVTLSCLQLVFLWYRNLTIRCCIGWSCLLELRWHAQGVECISFCPFIWYLYLLYMNNNTSLTMLLTFKTLKFLSLRVQFLRNHWCLHALVNVLTTYFFFWTIRDKTFRR